MSSKNKPATLKEEAKPALVPKLRFPDFRGKEVWMPVPLQKASTPVTERVGERKLTPVSISAGIGFVPQAEKFGRDISGDQYQRYTLVSDGDFVYNKGNSLKFPQGCVYQLQGWGKVAAPNVFICFRLKDGYSAGFFQNCFEQNMHGMQLKKHITSGARSNGLLNISKDHFFGIEIPTPSQAEQQKIADCLSSVDELIAAQARKVDALKKHKKWLMQHLFPREGETRPRLRFPDFYSAGEWHPDTLEGLCAAKISYGIVQAGVHVSDGMPYIKSTDLNAALLLDKLSRTSDAVAQKYRRSEVLSGDIVFSLRGNIGAMQIVPESISVANLTQGTARIRPRGSVDFYVQALQSPCIRSKILAVSKGSTFKEISLEALRKVRLLCPEIDEQKRIASCLSSLDAIVTAELKMLEALKTHKKGLMQQLFPSAGEVDG